MKTIEVDDELYRFIASHTQHIGESASHILRRMLQFSGMPIAENHDVQPQASVTQPENSPLIADTTPRDRVRAMRELLLSDDYAEQKKVVDRFMLILTTLYQLGPDEFALATESLRGRTRMYFAADQQTLLQSGVHTKPKQVAATPYWVITNTNTGRKQGMVEQIMQSMQFPAELIEKVCGTL
jgi:negative modulator of initiation of replication